MTTVQTTAETITVGDRLTLAGAPFVVTARVHGAWYLDCPCARYVEFELVEDAPAPLTGTNGRSVLRLPKDSAASVDRTAAVDSPADIAARLPLHLPTPAPDVRHTDRSEQKGQTDREQPDHMTRKAKQP